MGQLQELITPEEFAHVQAFPSILRLLYHGRLMAALQQNMHRLSSLKSITFHRVIDNKQISVESDMFWEHLNYHIIHLLDFLPAANWQASCNDALFNKFLEVHAFLKAANKLDATVDYEVASPSEVQEDQRPLSLGRLIMSAVPKRLLSKLAAKEIARFSAKVGHSLEFELCWG